MFREIMRRTEDMRRRICEKDRKWINNKLKELYQKANVIINNSKFTQSMMKKYFNLDTFVVYPPVDMERFKPKKFANPEERTYFFSLQRPHWQKRILLQIDAFKDLDEKLIIAGSGRKDEQLEVIVEDYKNIEYLGEVSNRKLIKLYTFAKAFIQTGYYEDFGLTPIKTLTCGTPCIVVDEGGFKETINNPKLGVRIRKPYLKNLKQAIINFDNNKYNSRILRDEVKKYSMENFEKEMEKYIKLAVERHAKWSN